ncbi:MAG: hypothetical protein LBR21_01340 [Propionibacteriaceae bacterium]|jgi:hypothetical protein|nr:hypothetical protein [Propionibacteriaceae bacterium]
MRLSIYGLIWRALPGPKWLKVILALLLFCAVVFVLMKWVFPVISDYMPFNNVTMDPDSAP